MSILLDIVFILAFLCYVPFLTIRRKWHQGFWQRIGFFSKELETQLAGPKKIWIHAVSVGEVLAIVDLVKRMAKEHADHKIICSTVTKTGHRIALDHLKDIATVIYAPLDFSWVVRKYIRLIDPRLYIATETEVWPNLYLALERNNVPIIQINGRISDKAYRGYQKIKFLTKNVLDCVTCFIMQTPTDAERIEKLGAAPERIKVFGNIKFDNVPEVDKRELEKFPFAKNDILVAGSTHPGEEEIILESYQALIKNFPELRLIITPRHIERSTEVAKIVESKGFEPILFSQMGGHALNKNTVIVVDVVGQLRNLYALAKIVFIGKTFRVGGGQNMIEPASFGKAVVVGPLTYNFRDVVKIFLNENAIVEVQMPEALAETFTELLKDNRKRKDIEQRAARIVERYKGATTKTLEVVSELLKEKERYYTNKLNQRSFKNYFYELIMSEPQGLKEKIVKSVLWILSVPYRGIIWVRRFLYDRGILKSIKVNAPVISVGNITWGGSGKTPFVDFLVQELKSMKSNPVVLTRGYMADKGAQESDEAKFLEETTRVPVVVGKNRLELAQNYLLKNHNVSCFVMDDGFQHWRLYRDLDIVLIDSTDPLNSASLIPAGHLREPVSALKRAHVIVFTKTNLERSHMRALKSQIKSINPQSVLVESIHEPVSLIDLRSGEKKDLNILIGQEIVSCCGIAMPYAFAETLKLLEAKIIHQFSFLDHHVYRAEEIKFLSNYLQEKNIKVLVTTEKDAGKLKIYLDIFGPQIKIYALKMRLTITDGKDAFFERIRSTVLH